MITNRAAHDNLIARLNGFRRKLCGEHTDAGGVDINAVALAMLNHFGVATDNLNARRLRRLRDRLDDFFQGLER